MVDYPIGDLIAERVRAMGVKPFYKQFEHDGVNGPNMATVYSDRGLGVRAPVVFYNRCNEAAAQLKPGDFDWKAIFAQRRALVPLGRHLRGALGDDFGADHRGDEGGAEAGVVTSFDLNYREKLWKPQGGMKRAHEVLGEIVENVDVLVGNEEDLQKGLGFPGPEVSAARSRRARSSTRARSSA